jgi:hypothetical protein
MEPLSQAQITRYLRMRVDALLVDDSGVMPDEVAIYTLSDPREIRQVRYGGQSTDPRRHYLQHLNQSRLWLLDETAWWIKSPKLRPLSEWIRALYRDEHRLPSMMIAQWTDRFEALRAEQRHIHSCLGADLPLLNRESLKSKRRKIAASLN